MDKIFIKMCEKSVEIQRSWNIHVGDYVSMCRPNHMNDKVIDIIARKEYDDRILGFSPNTGEYDEILFEKPTEIFTDYWSRRFSNQLFDIKNFEVIWLPRQDQLQDMIDKKDLFDLMDDFQIWFYNSSQYKNNELRGGCIQCHCAVLEVIRQNYVKLKQSIEKVKKDRNAFQTQVGAREREIFLLKQENEKLKVER